VLSGMKIQAPKELEEVPNAADLGAGEKEVVAFGLRAPNAMLILDEQIGRFFAPVLKLTFTGMAKAILHNSDYRSVWHCKGALDKYFAARNETYRRNPRRVGKKIWGKELVKPCFIPSNNCKDPNWR